MPYVAIAVSLQNANDANRAPAGVQSANKIPQNTCSVKVGAELNIFLLAACPLLDSCVVRVELLLSLTQFVGCTAVTNLSSGGHGALPLRPLRPPPLLVPPLGRDKLVPRRQLLRVLCRLRRAGREAQRAQLPRELVDLARVRVIGLGLGLGLK